MGCGNRPFEKYIDGYYVGVDNSHGKPDVVASVLHAPIKDEVADSVICSEVLEHIHKPMDCLREIHRILKKGGVLYLTVPMYWYQHYQPHDYWRFTMYSLISLISSTGLRVFYMNRYGGLNYFIVCRIVESIYYQLRKWFNSKISLILLAPLQILGYWYSKLDKFNKKDVAGWVVLAKK